MYGASSTTPPGVTRAARTWPPTYQATRKFWPSKATEGPYSLGPGETGMPSGSSTAPVGVTRAAQIRSDPEE